MARSAGGRQLLERGALGISNSRVPGVRDFRRHHLALAAAQEPRPTDRALRCRLDRHSILVRRRRRVCALVPTAPIALGVPAQLERPHGAAGSGQGRFRFADRAGDARSGERADSAADAANSRNVQCPTNDPPMIKE